VRHDASLQIPTGGDERAVRHLLLCLKPLNRTLKAAAEVRAAANAQLALGGTNASCITEQHVHQLFAAVDRFAEGDVRLAGGFELTAAEADAEERLRRAAAAAATELPLDALATSLQLSAFELQAILLCAATQLHPAYGRICAYVHDDMHRRAPSLQLLASLGARSVEEQLGRRRLLEPHGRLCRLRLLRITSDTQDPLHREYALEESVLRSLTTTDARWEQRYFDADAVDTSQAIPLALFPDGEALARIADLLRGEDAAVVGLWGPRSHGAGDAAVALAASIARPLRRATVDDEAGVHRALAIANALGAIAWIDTETIGNDERRTRGFDERLGEVIASAATPVILTGAQPWRPLSLFVHRNFTDVTLRAPAPEARAALWQEVVREADPATCRLLAEQYQISPREMHAAARVARLQARLRSNGESYSLARALLQACRTISLRGGTEFAKLVVPRRRRDDLVLPADLHRRVLEVAAFYRAWSRVDEGWGFGRLLTGGGIKVLMTGDSGTGKTAAAEVIAGEIDAEQVLLKVHLASVVSKWVGETEKNLEAVFQKAEESHAILFFDEADVLFAKRGEVERGSDRYSNLEVGFLLQRLEDFAGLAILASNHKDQIDEAFMRRFQVVLHFPRPGLAERRRLWQLALPAQAPKADDIDIEVLQQLDLTGAGIVNAARTAALLAAQEDDARIGMKHLISAVDRQFQHEARVLPTAQLGRFARLAESAA
jgi:hypothetical protein